MIAQHWFRFVIDWIGLPSLALLAVILVYRRWHREFPFFFCYIVGTELIGVSRLIFIRAPASVYSHVYWISDTALAGFVFLATYELFFKRLFPGFYKTVFYRLLFPAMALLITLLVALISLVNRHSSALGITARVYVFLSAAILVFFAALMIVMGRVWTKQEFGIAFGFALDVSTSSIFLGMLSPAATRNESLNRIAVFAYDIACIIWLYCFWRAPKSEPAVPTAPLPPGTLREAKKWEESLKDYISSGKR
jgi:hypothetical protein